jgi:phosphoribosyl-ATP pyrophosphohydrolase
MAGSIEDYLEDIEDAYGESKMSKVDKMIRTLKDKFSEAEFDGAAKNFFDLEVDPELYNKIKAAFQGRKIKEQLGGGCRFNAGLGRCYTDKSSDYAEECVQTTGLKGKQGCKRKEGLQVLTAARGAAGYTGRKMTENAKAKAAATRAAKKAALTAEGIDEFFNDPVFRVKFEQLGGECGYMPKTKRQVGGECGYMPKGRRQVGGGCRFNAGLGRCYTDKSSDYAEECVQTTGLKGKQGCKRKEGLQVLGAARGPAGYTGRKMTDKAKAKAAITRKVKEEAGRTWVSNPLFQEGGYWSDDGNDMIDTRDALIGDELDYEGGEQLGGGCRFNAGLGRCYTDKSSDYADECVQTTGLKGKQGCKRKEGLQVLGAARGPAGYTGRKMTDKAKAKAAITRKVKEEAGRTWVSNPLFQAGGYWI